MLPYSYLLVNNRVICCLYQFHASFADLDCDLSLMSKLPEMGDEMVSLDGHIRLNGRGPSVFRMS